MINTKNPKQKPNNSPMPPFNSSNPEPKSNIFLNNSLPMINGLNWAISWIVSDMLSRGRMKSESSKNMLPTETAPKIAVSSVLKIEPNNIPIKINKLNKINKINIK